MGELYLDNIERTAVRETGSPSIRNRPERRFVTYPDTRRRGIVCRQPYRDDHTDIDRLIATVRDRSGHRDDVPLTSR